MTDSQLMPNIVEFLDFVKRENPDLNEMCQFAVIRTFGSIGATSMFGAVLEPDGLIRPQGQFGFSQEVMKSWEVSSITDSTPTTDALKTNNIVWVGEKSEWEREYPHLTKYGLDMTANAYVTWPITVRGSYMSVLGLCLNRSLAPTPGLISFMETIGGIIALQLSQSERTSTSSEEDRVTALMNLFSRRQRDVMHLVSEGLTNPQIATELGFSESTIRQETMRIYEILGATGRADAVRMYRSIGQRKIS
jgi:DNA-binding CsgD family transcriptional regulator